MDKNERIRVRTEHHKAVDEHWIPPEGCAHCHQAWPCDTIRLLEDLEKSESLVGRAPDDAASQTAKTLADLRVSHMNLSGELSRTRQVLATTQARLNAITEYTIDESSLVPEEIRGDRDWWQQNAVYWRLTASTAQKLAQGRLEHIEELRQDCNAIIDKLQAEAAAQRERAVRLEVALRLAAKALGMARLHVGELEEAWRSGALREHDGKGGTRSNRNVEMRVVIDETLAALATPPPAPGDAAGHVHRWALDGIREVDNPPSKVREFSDVEHGYMAARKPILEYNDGLPYFYPSLVFCRDCGCTATPAGDAVEGGA